jgi:hypothetical protein
MACFPPCRDISRSARKLVPRRVQGNDFAFGVLDNRSVRGFDRMMPAFGDVLSEAKAKRILAHMRSLCTDDAWPHGELNVPKALFT